MLPVFEDMPNSFFSKPLPEHLLNDCLLPRLLVPNTDYDTCSNIAGDRTAKNSRSQCLRPMVVVDGPSTSTQSDLEERVTIQQTNNSD